MSPLGCHAFTGCDTVSSFVGHGKVSAMKLVKAKPVYQEVLKELGNHWDLNKDLLYKLQGFTSQIYNSQTTDIN